MKKFNKNWLVALNVSPVWEQFDPVEYTVKSTVMYDRKARKEKM